MWNISLLYPKCRYSHHSGKALRRSLFAFALAYDYGKAVEVYPASVSKVMTAILLCDNILDLNAKVAVKESDRQPPTGTNFVAGDTLRLREYLQCMLMESSNTSAQVIARYVGNILLNKDNRLV